MILPIIGQLAVTPDGLGNCAAARVNHRGEYTIDVRCISLGYAKEYLPSDVRLLEIKFEDGTVYDAHAAYLAKYPATPQERSEAPRRLRRR